MTAFGISEFVRWYGTLRTQLPYLPDVAVTDDLPTGVTTETAYTDVFDGVQNIRIAPDSIPGEAIVAHEMGHVVEGVLFRQLVARYGQTVGPALATVHEHDLLALRALTTNGPDIEGFAAMVGEALSGQVGGYYSEDVPTAQAKLAAWDRTAVLAALGAIPTWTPTDAQVSAATPQPTEAPKVEATIPPTDPSGTRVVDFYGPHDAAFYQCLASHGISGIARYLTIECDTDPRAITTEEVQFAHDAGLDIHFFFEMDPTYSQYFTFANGQRDARAAHWHLQKLGAPHQSVVYFTVDAPPSRIPPTVLVDYFNGIEDVLRNEDDGSILPGIYGFEAHVEFARANFPNVGKHLAQTYGTPRGPLDLWQHEQTNLCGIDVDINDCSVEGWKGDDMTADQVRQIVADYLANQYGPALEAELAQRLSDNSSHDVGAAVTAAVAAVGAKLTA